MSKPALCETIKWLGGDFSILSLGAAGDKDLPAEFLKAITLLEMDALSSSKTDDSRYFKRISFKKAISGEKGKRLFYRRNRDIPEVAIEQTNIAE